MEKVKDATEGGPGLYRVTGLMNDGSEVVDEYNTVIQRLSRTCITDVIPVLLISLPTVRACDALFHAISLVIHGLC